MMLASTSDFAQIFQGYALQPVLSAEQVLSCSLVLRVETRADKKHLPISCLEGNREIREAVGGLEKHQLFKSQHSC